ncbi:hypothetical protein INR49_006960 [Caranx melampygus]|nr:hypothetical protein INR49_006960 [Caranx melampygus]
MDPDSSDVRHCSGCVSVCCFISAQFMKNSLPLSRRLFSALLYLGFSPNTHSLSVSLFVVCVCVCDALTLCVCVCPSPHQEFNTSGSSNTDTGKASGSLETKYKMKEFGLSFNQKWNTDNTLATEVTVEDQSGKLKTGYKRDYVNLGCDVDFEGPIIHAAAVLGYEGWLAGYQMAFDTAKSKLAQNNFALGYRAGDFQLHTNVVYLWPPWALVAPQEPPCPGSDCVLPLRNDGTEFGGSIYQKVNDELETATVEPVIDGDIRSE